MKYLRICMVIDYFHPVVGGSEIQAYRLSRALLGMSAKITVLTRKYPGIPESSANDPCRIHRLSVPGRSKAGSALFLSKVLLFLVAHRSEYTIIHCHLATSTALGCLMGGALTKTPVLIKLGCSGKSGDVQTSIATLPGRIKLRILKRGRCHFVAPSHEIAHEMIRAGFHAKSISIIPNGVDTDYFSPLNEGEKRVRREKHGLSGRNLALYIGRLEQHKDILLLIDAWAGLHEKKGGWVLWIMGSGSLEAAIKECIQEKGMEEGIVLIPPVVPERVRDYLQIGDLFIQPSRSEGLSNAILEAMSCGLPIIAARIRGNREMIAHGSHGLLFAPGNVGDLIGCLRHAISDDQGRMCWGENARKRVIERFNLKNVAMKYLKLYYYILSGRE